jgi:O-antigen/teichoic acid export membrane protein
MKIKIPGTGYLSPSKAMLVAKNFIKSNIGFSYTGQIFVIAASLIQMFLINIYLGLDKYGTLVTLISIFTLMSLLTHFKTKEVTTRYLVTEIKRKSSSQIHILKIGILLDTLSLFIMLSLSYFVIPEIINILKIDFKNFDYIMTFALYFGINLFQNTFIGYFQANKKFNIINSLLILQSVLLIVFICIYIIFYKFNLMHVINSLLFASLITTLIYGILLYLNIKQEELSVNDDKSTITKSYFSLGFKLYLGGFVKIGYVNFENPILLFFTNLETVGLYQTIKKVFIPITFIIQPLGMLTASSMINYFDSNKKTELHDLILKNSKYLILASIPIYILIFSLTEYYLNLQLVNIGYLDGDLYKILCVLAIYSFLPLLSWWSSNFVILYKPVITIYTNFTASITNITFPIIVMTSSGYNTLYYFVLALLVARIPTWVVSFILYIRYRSESIKYNTQTI